MVNPPYSTIRRRLVESTATTILNFISTTIVFRIVFSSAGFAGTLQEGVPGIVFEIEVGVQRPDFNFLENLGAILVDDDLSGDLRAFAPKHVCA